MTPLDLDDHETLRIERPGGDYPTVGLDLGPYRLNDVLGRGASARVYAAHDVAGREVALKVVHAPSGMTQVMRLLIEAEVLGRIHHPGVLRIEGPPGRQGPWRYLALAPLAGPTLREARGPWPEGRLTGIARQLAEALGAVHAASVIHCDVKPENIVLSTTRDGAEQVTLIDFDAARWLDRDTGRRAAVLPVGTVFGTPGYMAPEQHAGEDVDESADVYAYGAVLYELMAGTSPAPGLWGRWRRKRALRLQGYSEALADVVLACLAEAPGERPSVEAILERLGPDSIDRHAA